jgi:hypothetical protein
MPPNEIKTAPSVSFIFSKVVSTKKLFCICQCPKCGLTVFSKNNSVHVAVCACGAKDQTNELQKFKISESDMIAAERDVEVHK